jgi:hypothetical protein
MAYNKIYEDQEELREPPCSNAMASRKPFISQLPIRGDVFPLPFFFALTGP